MGTGYGRGGQAAAQTLRAAQYAHLVVESAGDEGIQYSSSAFHYDALQVVEV